MFQYSEPMFLPRRARFGAWMPQSIHVSTIVHKSLISRSSLDPLVCTLGRSRVTKINKVINQRVPRISPDVLACRALSSAKKYSRLDRDTQIPQRLKNISRSNLQARKTVCEWKKMKGFNGQSFMNAMPYKKCLLRVLSIKAVIWDDFQYDKFPEQ